jgi:hypothetical protein
LGRQLRRMRSHTMYNRCIPGFQLRDVNSTFAPVVG